MLDHVDQVALSNAGDIPGNAVTDLLQTLGILRYHGVSLTCTVNDIDTSDAASPLLDIIAAYRRAKLSQAIREGQAEALAAGKRIGRPKVSSRITNGIRTALIDGDGIRPTARRFDISPASVINIRRAMTVSSPNA